MTDSMRKETGLCMGQNGQTNHQKDVEWHEQERIGKTGKYYQRYQHGGICGINFMPLAGYRFAKGIYRSISTMLHRRKNRRKQDYCHKDQTNNALLYRNSQRFAEWYAHVVG